MSERLNDSPAAGWAFTVTFVVILLVTWRHKGPAVAHYASFFKSDFWIHQTIVLSKSLFGSVNTLKTLS